jgi:hypothetical protein
MHDQHKQKGGAVFVRLRGSVFDLLEDWRRSQAVIPSRSEAVRSLIERALPASDGASETAA